jgi:hypothetical protein
MQMIKQRKVDGIFGLDESADEFKSSSIRFTYKSTCLSLDLGTFLVSDLAKVFDGTGPLLQLTHGIQTGGEITCDLSRLLTSLSETSALLFETHLRLYKIVSTVQEVRSTTKIILQQHVQSACGSIHSLYELVGVAGYFNMVDLQSVASDMVIEQFNKSVAGFPPLPHPSLESPVKSILRKHLLDDIMVCYLLLDQQHGWPWLRLVVDQITSYKLSSWNQLVKFVQFQQQRKCYNTCMGYRLELGTRGNSSWLQTPEVHYVLENIGSKLISWSMKYNGFNC